MLAGILKLIVRTRLWASFERFAEERCAEAYGDMPALHPEMVGTAATRETGGGGLHTGSGLRKREVIARPHGKRM